MSINKTPGQIKSEIHLKNEMIEIINKVNGVVLDLVESAIGNRERFLIVRPKILKETNGAVREIERRIKLFYQLEYVSQSEDIIRIIN